MEFDLEQAITIANKLVYQKINRNLTDVEITILKGAWNRDEYDLIATRNNYSTSYLSQDVAPRLWKLLTEVLGEKVRKSNFKEALKRCWHEQNELERINNSNSESYSPQPICFSVNNLYVERLATESVCYQTLSQPGGLLRLKGSRLLGKTLLMNQVLARMASDRYAVANISLKLADKTTHLSDLNKFLRWFCSNLSRELKLPNQLNDYWDEEDLGSKVSCTLYLQDYLLAKLDRPLVLCLDDVDLLFPHPEIYEDFFALLRSWYEKARTRKKWKNLRMAIVHATDVYIRLNIYQSPFNVGLPLDLPEFTAEQTQELASKYQLQLDDSEIQSLVDLVGGHPYLLHQAFALLKSDRQLTMQELLAKATTESGIYSSHLRENWLDLEQHPELAVTFKKLVSGDRPLSLDPIQAYQLQNIGLIKLSGDRAVPRCNLYRQFFKEHLK